MIECNFNKNMTFFVLCFFLSSTLLVAHDSLKTKEDKVDERFLALETLSKTLFYIETMYVDPDKVKPVHNINHAIDGLLSHLDPHTMRLPEKAFTQLNEDNQGKYGGIGVMVHQEGKRLIVINPISASPAEKAGIKANDEILAIDGIYLTTLKEGEAIERMKGPVGSYLKLIIKRENQKDPQEFAIKRQIIEVKSVEGEMLSDGIGLLKIAHFQEKTSDDLNSWLKSMHKNLKGLVLDLRDNPGGLLDQAVKVVDTFVSSGLIVSTVGRDPDKIEREFATRNGSYTDFPLIVLINEGSASAAEIVTGALQDLQRALVMGTRSFGKGSVQTLIPLPDGSGLKFTIARYYTPNDRSIQAKGIIPDIFVPARKPIDDPKKFTRESDLTGHIEAQNLTEGQRDSISSSIALWPIQRQEDLQLVTAYTYLRGFRIFSGRSGA